MIQIVAFLLFSLVCSDQVQFAVARTASIQMAFGIMTYQREDRTVEETYAEFLRLMVNIYENEDNHLYILHTDVKSDPGLLEAINKDYCMPKANCRHITARNVAWGSLTTGEMMLALMRKADNFFGPNEAGTNGKNWEYFILLGHESFPLTSLKYTENFLSSYPRGSNFINCWPVSGYNFYGQWESNDWRLSNVVLDHLNGTLGDVPNLERKFPDNFPQMYKSLQHVVVSRAFVQYACYGEKTALIMIYLANVRTSDEMLLPTLLQSNEELASTAICNTTLHYSHWIRPGGSWHPEYLDLEHLPVLMQHAGIDALYARKMNLYTSDVLVWAIDKVREEALDDELLRSRLVFVGPSSPTTSPTLPPSIRKNSVAPSSSPTVSPGMQTPSDYISTMTWLVPIAINHIKSVYSDPNTVPRIKQAIDDTGILQKVHSSTSQDTSAIHPFAVLHALDAIRRVKDRITSKKFIEIFVGDNIELLLPPGHTKEQFVFDEITENFVADHPSNAVDDNQTPAVYDQAAPPNKSDGPIRKSVRKGLSSSTVRFKNAEITFDRLKSHDGKGNNNNNMN